MFWSQSANENRTSREKTVSVVFSLLSLKLSTPPIDHENTHIEQSITDKKNSEGKSIYLTIFFICVLKKKKTFHDR
jgi:hypothetical protein